MKGLLAGLALIALAGCSSGEEVPADEPGEAQAGGMGEAAQDTQLSEASRLLTSLTHPRQPGPWAPRDECDALAGAGEFRERLARAVQERDADALAALASPDVKLDFGGGAGVAELKVRLSAPDGELWQALENLVPLGCAASPEGTLTIPWYFAQEIPLDDPYMAMIVRGTDVPLLAEPKADAKAVTRLSWDAVEMVANPGAYAEVKTADGTTGYIEMGKLRSLIDYRLIAEKGADGWKIGALVAGD